jgi:hypothetical protein
MCDFLEELLQKEIFGGYTKRKENKWWSWGHSLGQLKEKPMDFTSQQ